MRATDRAPAARRRRARAPRTKAASLLRQARELPPKVSEESSFLPNSSPLVERDGRERERERESPPSRRFRNRRALYGKVSVSGTYPFPERIHFRKGRAAPARDARRRLATSVSNFAKFYLRVLRFYVNWSVRRRRGVRGFRANVSVVCCERAAGYTREREKERERVTSRDRFPLMEVLGNSRPSILESIRDKRTSLSWGVGDFYYRVGEHEYFYSAITPSAEEQRLRRAGDPHSSARFPTDSRASPRVHYACARDSFCEFEQRALFFSSNSAFESVSQKAHCWLDI